MFCIDVQNEQDFPIDDTDATDMNHGGNDFWNAGFGGGNSNMNQPDGFGANNGNFDGHADGGPGGFPQEKGINKPKVGHAFEAPLSPEEEERVAQIESEQQERLRGLKQKEEDEYRKKKEKKQEAKNELEDWYSNKQNERQGKSKQNKEEEWAYLKTRDEHKKSKNPWEKIVDNVEINPNKYLGLKDVSRMRQAMLARKGDLKENRKK